MTADQIRDFSLLYTREAATIDAATTEAVVQQINSLFRLVARTHPSGLSVQARIDAMDERAPGESARFCMKVQQLRGYLRAYAPERIAGAHADNEFVLWVNPDTGAAGVVCIPIPYDEERVIAHGQPSRAAAEAYRDTLVSERESAEAARLAAAQQNAPTPPPFAPDENIVEP